MLEEGCASHRHPHCSSNTSPPRAHVVFLTPPGSPSAASFARKRHLTPDVCYMHILVSPINKKTYAPLPTRGKGQKGWGTHRIMRLEGAGYTAQTLGGCKKLKPIITIHNPTQHNLDMTLNPNQSLGMCTSASSSSPSGVAFSFLGLALFAICDANFRLDS